MIVPAGQVATICGIPPSGGPLPGYNGDNQTGIATRIWRPLDVLVTAANEVIFVDGNNQRIRKISTGGIVSTICGTGAAGYNGDGIPPVNAHINGALAITLDKQSPANLFFSDAGNKRVRRFTP